MRVNGPKLLKWGVVCLAVLVLFAGFVGSALAQEATGALTGTVTDQKGLAMTGVSVVAHSEDTGTDLPAVMTNESGLYNFPFLAPGTYDVTASQPGFSTVQQKGIMVAVATTVRIDVQMPVAATQSLVTVTTEIPVLETEKTEQAQNVSENLVSNLPVSSRRWEQFAFLTPGITPDGATGGMSFHGINSNYNNNSVDGANNNSSYNGAARGGTSNEGYTYSGDSVREFQVESGSFNAELGQAAGGSVNAITKSGTSAFHGDLFYNGRTTPFNAYDPVSKTNAANVALTAPNSPAAIPGQTVRQQDQWGGSLGGPIIKDKLFFFITDDGYRRVNPLLTSTPQNNPSINALTCPTVASLSGPQQATLATECAAAKNFALTNVVGTFPRTIRQDIELVKLDYQLNQSNHLSAVANIRDWKQPTSTVSVNGTTVFLQDRFVIATANTVIGNDKVNELRYQYGVDNTWTNLNPLYGTPQVALTSLFTYGQSNGTTFTDEFRNQVSDNFSWTRGTHAIKFGVDINVVEDNARSATNSGGLYTYGGTLPAGVSCTAPTTGSQTVNGEFCDWLIDSTGTNVGDGKTGQHWASYAQVVDNVFPAAPETFHYDFFSTNYAGYIQDTWKARPNLTVNYGLRYDFQQLPSLPYSASNIFGNTNPAAGILDYYTDSVTQDYKAIQPRVGAAWNLRKNTVIRIGGGIFYGNTVGSAIKTIVSGVGESNLNCSTPVTTAGNCIDTSTPTTVGGTPALQFPNVLFQQQNVGQTAPNVLFPGSINAPVPVYGTNVTPAEVPGYVVPNSKTGIRALDPGAQRPHVYEAEAGVEQQLPGSFNLSINYTFTRGVSLPSQEDANIAGNFDTGICSDMASTPGGQQCGETITRSYTYPATLGLPAGAVTVPFFYQRINPATGPIITQFSDVLSTYNGLVITVRRPATHGFEILANYTYSKAFDDGQAGTGINAENFLSTDGDLDPYDRNYEYGPSSTDVRNRFTGSFVYTPPFAKNLNNMVERKFLDGWQISTTILASNGTHYSPTISTSGQQTDLVSGYAPGSSTLTTFTLQGLNGGMSGADIQTTSQNFGGRAVNFGRNSLVLPNLYNVDLRLTKLTTFKERYSIELRLEAFNLFNSTLVQAVNSNAYSLGTSGNVGTMALSSSFQAPTTTSGLLLAPRQLQAGLRFDF
jgi:hypothetical protein